MINKTFLEAAWDAPKQVKTIITTRINGFSTNEFSSFNLALHVNDNQLNVLQNRELLKKYLPDNPYWLNQTHSNKVISLDDENNFSSLNYDASIATQKHKICTVLTADCLPILITDKNADFVAAIHAGWRGVRNNIIKNTILMSNANPKNILVYIGPAICTKHFEVGYEVMEEFINLDPENHNFFVNANPNNNHQKYYCNLVEIAILQLLKLNIPNQNIYLSNLCTYCENDLFYSYRKQNTTGRFASLIWLDK